MKLKHDHYLSILYSATILHLTEMIINLHTSSLHGVFTVAELLLTPLIIVGIVGSLVTSKKKRSVN